MKMKSLLTLLAISVLFAFQSVIAQPAYYKVEDVPGELYKKINLWGQINRPGMYEVPLSTNLIQLMTYAGGPKDYAVLDDIKIYRLNENGTKKVISVDIEDYESVPQSLLQLYDEDTIIIDYKSIVSWREVFSTISGPLAVVASIVLILDRLTAKN